ncbi:hypothetical protein EA82_02320 [Enterococcus hirae]|uniref:Rha family transcriptional regulator n=2 Tax=Enterococcus hirae TaxID=1354 RepID=A0AB37I895_ENTHR|nr:hypothetical protein EB07_01963 [Enterococcus hirae]RBT56131.1 hypothetical protein EB10_00141 [Enterococcus hirae]RBT59816.1 hypothetical protein EB45_02106 [Enterococcus hirae]RBT65967.1 hypothetical protein EB03_02901 [Enterococcus hirae]RBT66973.1 hypothetical protein EA82_02320 [Enterococcus hirae]
MNLVKVKNNQVVTTSLHVAEAFDKYHKHVIEAIEAKIQSVENSAYYKNMFAEGEYKDSRGRKQRLYYMNRDGFAFIAFGFTGKKADDFKLKYIQAFNEMENRLRQRQIQQPANNFPKSYAEALRVIANLTERIKKSDDEYIQLSIMYSELKREKEEQAIKQEIKKHLEEHKQTYSLQEIISPYGFKGVKGANLVNQILEHENLLRKKQLANGKYKWCLNGWAKNRGFKVYVNGFPKWTEKGKEYIENKLEELGYTRKEVAE